MGSPSLALGGSFPPRQAPLCLLSLSCLPTGKLHAQHTETSSQEGIPPLKAGGAARKWANTLLGATWWERGRHLPTLDLGRRDSGLLFSDFLASHRLSCSFLGFLQESGGGGGGVGLHMAPWAAPLALQVRSRQEICRGCLPILSQPHCLSYVWSPGPTTGSKCSTSEWT